MVKFGNAGAGPKVSDTHVVAIYDPSDNRVIHLHHVVIFEGGKPVSKEDAESEALAAVRRNGIDDGAFRVVHISEELPHVRGQLRSILTQRGSSPNRCEPEDPCLAACERPPSARASRSPHRSRPGDYPVRGSMHVSSAKHWDSPWLDFPPIA